jgi:thiosulfate/3-mercaptopyruvate sulfurtransferase
MTFRNFRLVAAWMLFCLGLAAIAQPALSQSASLVPSTHLISPEELAHILKSGAAKPLILNVGPRMLYQQAHIPGAEYYGPGADFQAQEQLRERIAPLSRDTFIVIYCGCCPWSRCPNVYPAYTVMQQLGFTNVKVLKIDHDFGTDWVYKNYPSVTSTP